jgi:hypothetical protein
MVDLLFAGSLRAPIQAPGGLLDGVRNTRLTACRELEACTIESDAGRARGLSWGGFGIGRDRITEVSAS